MPRTAKNQAVAPVKDDAPRPVTAAFLIGRVGEMLAYHRREALTVVENRIKRLQEDVAAGYRLKDSFASVAEPVAAAQAKLAVIANAVDVMHSIGNEPESAGTVRPIAVLLDFCRGQSRQMVRHGFRFSSSCQISNVLEAAELSAYLEQWNAIADYCEEILDPARYAVVPEAETVTA